MKEEKRKKKEADKELGPYSLLSRLWSVGHAWIGKDMHEMEVCTESLEMELKLEVGALIFILYTAFFIIIKNKHMDFLGDIVDKNPPANAEDMGSIPSPGRSSMPQNLIGSAKPMNQNY